MHTPAGLKPFTHFNCNGCKANAHSAFESSDKLHVTGNCGETHTLGGCFGVVLYPVKNPSAEQHTRFYKTIKAHNEKARPVLTALQAVSNSHVIGLHEHDLIGSHALDSARGAA